MSQSREPEGLAMKITAKRGVYYFSHYEAARDHAVAWGFPTDRIIAYELGWAIQLRRGGDYVGPNTPRP
jgi:hypothetical protein